MATDQPTEERFKRIEEEQRYLREEVKQLREQITEPIKVTRIEVASEDVVKRLDSVQEDTNILKIEMKGTRADVLRMSESQADLRDRLIEYGQRLESIESKQDAQTEVLGQLMNHAELTATKDDISRVEATQHEQSELLKQILTKLEER